MYGPGQRSVVDTQGQIVLACGGPQIESHADVGDEHLPIATLVLEQSVMTEGRNALQINAVQSVGNGHLSAPQGHRMPQQAAGEPARRAGARTSSLRQIRSCHRAPEYWCSAPWPRRTTWPPRCHLVDRDRQTCLLY